MDPSKFKGTGVALVTPFRSSKVDFEALEKLIEHCIAGGVDYLVSLGTTGESSLLTEEEQREVLDFTIRVNRKRLPIVAGNFGESNTAKLCDKVKNYNFTGIDAILSSSPAYVKPSQEGIYLHYMALEAVSPLPVIIYNVPGRTSSNILAETLLRLNHASAKFIGVKEASGSMVQGSEILKGRSKDFLVISGDDPTALSLLSLGGDGVISVIANALPAQFSKMIGAGLSGDFRMAASIHQALQDVHPLLYVEGNPTGIKAALEILGICSRDVRLPLARLSEKYVVRLHEELQKTRV